MSHNTVCSIVYTAVLCCTTAVAQPSTSALGAFVTVDVPGAAVTRAMGINTDGAVVGDFTDSAGKQHGFLLRGGIFTTIDYPGAAKTQAKGINSQGDIVGARFDDTSGAPSAEHGFLLLHGSFTALDYPGKLGLIPQRINDAGQIVGCNHDNDLMASMHGFVYSNGAWSQLDTGASMTNAGLPDGSFGVGLYTDMMTNQSHAFVLSGGKVAPVDFPFATTTWGWDLNTSGEMVGQYTDHARSFTDPCWRFSHSTSLWAPIPCQESLCPTASFRLITQAPQAHKLLELIAAAISSAAMSIPRANSTDSCWCGAGSTGNSHAAPLRPVTAGCKLLNR